jgi:RimJ/RimL family protein N-acetyltransferase
VLIPADIPVLTDGVVTLRGPRPDDIPGAVERYADDPESSYGEADVHRWISYGMAEAWASGTRLNFIIEYQGRYAGSVGLEPDLDGNAGVHFGLARWAQGAGVAARAVRLALEFGFGTCGVFVIHWRAATRNWPSRRVAWATGFRFGPTIPNLFKYGGRRSDAWTAWIGPGDPREPRQPWFDSPLLETPRLRLRPWRADEVARISAARTNDATAHFLPFIPQPFSEEDAHWLLGHVQEQAASGLRLNWCVADVGTDLGLSNVTLFNIDDERVRDGELGYWAHPDAQGRGVTAEAIRRIADWYFAPVSQDGFGGLKLVIRTAATNKAARRVAESAGFRHVGTDRAAFPLGDGTLDDRVTYDRLSTD